MCQRSPHPLRQTAQGQVSMTYSCVQPIPARKGLGNCAHSSCLCFGIPIRLPYMTIQVQI